MWSILPPVFFGSKTRGAKKCRSFVGLSIFFLVFMNMPNVSADAVSANFSFLVCSRHRGRALVGFFVGLRLPNAKVCSYALVLLSVGQDCFLVVSATTTKCQ